jgi:molecular chaperone GrpE
MTQEDSKQPEAREGNGISAEQKAGQEAPTEQTADAESGDVGTLSQKVKELKAEADKFRDQLQRKAAEFENYKRRTDETLLSMQKYAGERLMLALLPIVDDFARSMKSVEDQKPGDPFYKGIELIHSKFMQILKAQGVEPLESVGKQFNVDEHDAIMQMPKPGAEPHTVLEEVEKGYKLFDKVLRHAKVVVAADQGDSHGKA